MSKITEGPLVWLGNSRPGPMETHRPSEVRSKPVDLAITSQVRDEGTASSTAFHSWDCEQICSFDRNHRRSSSSPDLSRAICSVVATALEPHLLHIAELIQAPPSSVVATGPDNQFREAPRRSCCRRNRLIANSATDAAHLQEPRRTSGAVSSARLLDSEITVRISASGKQKRASQRFTTRVPGMTGLLAYDTLICRQRLRHAVDHFVVKLY